MASRYKSMALDSISQNSKEGEKVIERGNEIQREAVDTEKILSGIEVVDEDTQAALDDGIQESRDVTDRLANVEIYTPSKEISNNLREIGRQMSEDSKTEMNNAKCAEQIGGDYSDVGSSVEARATESSEQFQEIADDGNENADSLDDSADSIIEDLLEVFS